MDDLLDNVTGFVGFYLVTESDNSLYNVSNESSEDYEDEESDEISIVFCAIRTRYCSLIASL